MDKLTRWTYLNVPRWERRQHKPGQIIILALVVGLLIIGPLAYACTWYVTNYGVPGFDSIKQP